MPIVDRMIQIVAKRKKNRKNVITKHKMFFFPLTNSLNVRESSNFIESSLIKSFNSRLTSLGLNSLNNLCKANPLSAAKSSFNLSEFSESIGKNK